MQITQQPQELLNFFLKEVSKPLQFTKEFRIWNTTDLRMQINQFAEALYLQPQYMSIPLIFAMVQNVYQIKETESIWTLQDTASQIEILRRSYPLHFIWWKQIE